MSDDPIHLYWHVCDNFGDALSPWIVEQVTGQSVAFADAHVADGPIPIIAIGSILGPGLRRGRVWGAGSAFERDLQPGSLPEPSERFQIAATRGPLSAELVRRSGHDPKAYGDPGLLLPRYFTPDDRPSHRVGMICSWIDAEISAAIAAHHVPVVSTFAPRDRIINEIASWDLVVSSCLHGLVTGIAYGKAVAWSRVSDNMVGDGFKFLDFFASLGIADPICTDVAQISDLKSAELHAYEASFDTDLLLEAFPR